MLGGGATGMMGGGMIAADGMGMGDGGPMRQMMSPEHVEGRIAFLRTELKATAAQQPLWDAVADALRANSAASKGMMPAMMGGMMQPGASQKPRPHAFGPSRWIASSEFGALALLCVLGRNLSSAVGWQASVAE